MPDFPLIFIQVLGLICDQAASMFAFGGNAGLIDES
jgi:hypothetical protein